MQTIVITGTTTGIGKAIASKFSNNAWNVIELNRPEFDVSNPQIIEAWDPEPMDVFINNAGIMPLIDFEKTTLEDWERIINTNLRGPFFLAQKAIPKIKDKGHLINIASISGIGPDKEFICYSVSKAALISMTIALSKRYGDRIFVNCISPGFVDTDLTTDVEQTPQHLIDDIPMKRQADPVEVARLVYFLVMDCYFNGANLVYDGGLLAKYSGA